MTNCSSNCTTQDHESFGACLRAKAIATQWLGGVQESRGDQRRFQAVNDRYRNAVREGLTPDGVSHRSIDKAYRAAEV